MTEQERAQGNQAVVRTGNRLHDFNELESILDNKNPSLLKPVRKGTQPETAAARLRKELLDGNTNCDCVPDICELLENTGVKIFLCDFNVSERFGLSIGEADGGPAMTSVMSIRPIPLFFLNLNTQSLVCHLVVSTDATVVELIHLDPFLPIRRCSSYAG